VICSDELAPSELSEEPPANWFAVAGAVDELIG
jgi:hypothetical protein